MTTTVTGERGLGFRLDAWGPKPAQQQHATSPKDEDDDSDDDTGDYTAFYRYFGM
jgi:hypothetical protein